MGRRTKHTKTSVKKALEEADGIVETAMVTLDVSKSTMYNYLKRWQLWDVVQTERDDLVHLAKRGLAYHLRSIERGEAPPAWAIKYTLSTLAKEEFGSGGEGVAVQLYAKVSPDDWDDDE